MSLSEIVKISNRFGSNPDLVLAGGGNTSFKDDEFLYVKGSGTTLASITEDGFVKMSRKALGAMWIKQYSSDAAAREEEVLEDLMDARAKSDRNKRPSVETSLHDILPQQYVVHLHPAMVNGITCGKDGKKIAEQLWGDSVVWVGETEPGWTLATLVKKLYDENVAKTGKTPMAILLQNHGIFVAGNSAEEIESIYNKIFADIESKLVRKPSFDAVEFDEERASYLAPEIRMILRRGEGTAIVTTENNTEFAALLASADAFKPVNGAFTPDHIVYYKPWPLFVAYAEDLAEQQKLVADGIEAYRAAHGYDPKIVAVQNTAVFAFGSTKKNADTSMKLFKDAVKISVYAASFGGYSFMSDKLVKFIENWEVEKYRSKVSADQNAKRLAEKIVIVTGGAQGFGEGIADSLLVHGCNLVVADLNEEGSQKKADAICDLYGAGKSIAVKVNVGNEESVHNLLTKTVLAYGGIDLFVSNAGIARSGNLEEVTQQSLELHLNVNYTGFFLCSKYASRIMKIQNAYDASYTADIVQVNSKSGLEGSNKNFAYAGSKFGGIGLVQSFALELCPYGIKVNAVCPGNYLDGPLWSDPVKGLFVQYLNSGKVPGAKNVDDVRKFYMAKVPMNRGCLPSDVATAVMYCMEQPYETGQAIPVTGGQVMLK